MIRWLKTTRDAYAAIYSAHRGNLQVHGACTRMENSSLGDKLILTEWGLPGADFPIMKHEEREDGHEFFLAVVQREDEA